jgi:hypothetical protein
MEALGEILRDELPVRLHVGDDALRHAQSRESVTREAHGMSASVSARGGASGPAIHEHETAGDVHRDLEQRVRPRIEVGCGHSPRRGDQTAFEIVRPRVIGADDALAPEASSSVVHKIEPRCRQVLWNARNSPSSARSTTIDWFPMRTTRHAPRPPISVPSRDDPPPIPEDVELARVMRGSK